MEQTSKIVAKMEKHQGTSGAEKLSRLLLSHVANIEAKDENVSTPAHMVGTLRTVYVVGVPQKAYVVVVVVG